MLGVFATLTLVRAPFFFPWTTGLLKGSRVHIEIALTLAGGQREGKLEEQRGGEPSGGIGKLEGSERVRLCGEDGSKGKRLGSGGATEAALEFIKYH